ncbi:hypothetical protein Q8F55_005548 [Vanrija albida]|uniref:Uncharacterized protein n=1 Tax=Vanrija albida TaxID=181172 RepID=A0ABR3Q1Y0_9TREE
MTQVESLRVPPQLGPVKTGSLSADFDPKAVAILNTYSPFPTFPGSNHSSDPFGLNAFLLNPHDDMWNYLQPMPIPHDVLDEADRPKEVVPTADPLPLDTTPPRPARSAARNIRRRSSPLASNPPVSPDEEAKETKQVKDEVEAEPHPAPRARKAAPVPPAKSTLRTMIGRKSMTASLASSTDSLALTDDETPLSTRTHSMCSALSTSSSDSSCDGVQTPRDGSPLDINAANARLDALNQLTDKAASASASEASTAPKSGWRDWLGSKRVSFLGLRGDPGTTLLESPRASVLDLTPEIPEPQAAIAADSEAGRSVVALRRLSLTKLGSLRMPSPHPLALLLTRQHANLPDEVAFSIPATKRVFPMSVNVVQGFNSELSPAQGGLRLALGVRGVIAKIDQGEAPKELLRPRKAQRHSTILRPRGVRDFVSRRPFEERSVVFDSDGVCSHVTMARPGYAIWELDYSEYILALSEAEDCPITWPIPRSSTGNSSLGKPILKVTNPDPPRAAAAAAVAAPVRPKSAVRSPARSPAQSPPTSPPKSSFRTARPKLSTWDDSSDEELDTEDETAVAPKKIVSMAAPARPPVQRTQTAPARAMRESRLIDPSSALDEITRARERRELSRTGEIERQAEGAEKRRQSQLVPQRPITKRSSTMTLSATAQRQAAQQAAQQEERRQARASSISLTKPQVERPKLSHRASSATLAGTAKAAGRKPVVDASSLPSSPHSKPQPDRRRVVSQYDPTAQALHHRASVMGLGMYGMVPPVPVVPAVYSHPMVYPAPTVAAPGVVYHAQFPATVSRMSAAMYAQPPPPQVSHRRRERPVS